MDQPRLAGVSGLQKSLTQEEDLEKKKKTEKCSLIMKK